MNQPLGIQFLHTHSFPLICPINNHWERKGRSDDIEVNWGDNLMYWWP